MGSCELLLFFEIQIFVTAYTRVIAWWCLLWIAFVLWNSDICHSWPLLSAKIITVVNCFCSLKFRYLSQQKNSSWISDGCCELLLFFEIQIFVTAWGLLMCITEVLWIAFVLWNSDICHSFFDQGTPVGNVVNCFCSLKFRYLSQHFLILYCLFACCELLLFFEIQIFVTALLPNPVLLSELWIAFVLWNSDICHSMSKSNTTSNWVVNCFCSLKFRYLSQLATGRRCYPAGCELLLFFEIQIFVTAYNDATVCRSSCELLLFFEIQIFVTAIFLHFLFVHSLWIAFVLWNSDICHSKLPRATSKRAVVNCFCSLKFRYLSQHF